MSKADNPFRYFHSPPEVIRLVVMIYVRFPLSLRNVENLLFGRPGRVAKPRGLTPRILGANCAKWRRVRIGLTVPIPLSIHFRAIASVLRWAQ